MKPRKSPPKQSKRRKVEALRYPKLKREFFRHNYNCFRCGDPLPEREKQLHHFFGRVGKLLCWVPGFRLTCSLCHFEIETHRNEAVKQGYRAPDNLFNRPSLVIPK